MGKIKEVDKKTIYLFKKFARENRFWETYKKYAKSLNCTSRTSFVHIVQIVEPIKLIQSSTIFNSWMDIPPHTFDYWSSLSREWARICLKEGLYHNKNKCYSYALDFIVGLTSEEKRQLLENFDF